MIVPYGLGIITTQQESQRAKDARRGRLHWAPMIILAFFGVVATVNALLISFATHGMPSHLVGVLLPEPQSQATEVTPTEWGKGFGPRTALGMRLATLRTRAVAAGMRLLTEDEVLEEVKRRRGEIEDNEADLY